MQLGTVGVLPPARELRQLLYFIISWSVSTEASVSVLHTDAGRSSQLHTGTVVFNRSQQICDPEAQQKPSIKLWYFSCLYAVTLQMHFANGKKLVKGNRLRQLESSFLTLNQINQCWRQHMHRLKRVRVSRGGVTKVICRTKYVSILQASGLNIRASELQQYHFIAN